ncbi:MAG: TolC family protein [Pseudomonadota bacterium]
MKRILIATLLLASGSAQALGLREIALTALKHDPRFAESSARIEAAKYGTAVADAGDKFTLGLAADVGRSDLRTDARFPESGYRTPNSLAIAASQPLYNGGRSAAERNAAALTLDAVTQHRREVGGKIILAALTATLDLKRDRETLKLAEASRGTLDAARGDVDKRYQAGEATRTDLAQADARRAEATANVRRAEAQLRTSEIRLSRLTGPLPADAAEVPWPELLPTAKTRAEAIEQSHRAPAVVAAAHEQQAAKAAIRIAEAAARPQLSLDARAATQDNTEFGYDRLSTWAVQLKLNVPIVTGGLTAARRGEAVARAEIAAAAAADESAAYAEAAAQDWELLRASEDVIAATRVQVSAAESALDGVQKELKVGSRTTLDLLDAERELLAAQVNLVTALRDRGVTAFSLMAASGILELHNVPE